MEPRGQASCATDRGGASGRLNGCRAGREAPMKEDPGEENPGPERTLDDLFPSRGQSALRAPPTAGNPNTADGGRPPATMLFRLGQCYNLVIASYNLVNLHLS